jgi:15-cis-phytoene synthase
MTAATATDQTIDLFADARRITRAYAKSFYFASHVLPAEKRDAAFAVYAFCRHADNIVDCAGPGNPEAVRSGLSELRAELYRMYAGNDDVQPLMRTLGITVRRFGIPRQYLADLLDGMEMDLETPAYESFEDLELYCYRVASVVGLVTTHIFGTTSPDALLHAAELGIAMQLTNILRDVGEDHAMGRIYLPRQELHRFGTTDEDLSRGRMTPQFKDFMRFQICRARDWYRRADAGIPQLTDDGSRFCVRLMSRIYENILEAIERNDYDVFTRRAFVPTSTKLRIAFGDILASRLAGHSAAGTRDVTVSPYPQVPLTFHATRLARQRRSGFTLPLLPRTHDIHNA